jgi:hypothetical protein
LFAQSMAVQKFAAREAGNDHFGKWMTYISCIHIPLSKPGLFKREKAKEFPNALADRAHAALSPGPDLRGDQIKDRHMQQIQVTCKAEVKIRAVREDGGVGRMGAKLPHQATVVAIDAGKVADDFCQSDDGKPGRVEDGFDPGLFESRAGATKIGRVAVLFFQGANESGCVHVAGRLTSGNQDAHVCLSVAVV